MNCRQAKEIPIPMLLESLGMQCVRRDGNGAYYRSPWSTSGDRNPSFQVSKDGHAFHDWANGQHGDIIELTKLIIGQDSVSAALRYLTMSLPSLTHSHMPSCLTNVTHVETHVEKQPKIVVTDVRPIETKVLLGYLWGQRGIHRTIASEYCREIHYHIVGRPEKRYFAVGWRNDSGGFELRNAIVKQAIAPKDITTVGDLANCPYYVFEGFLDYLSAVQLEIMDLPRSNAIVLNSTALVGRAIEALGKNGATEVICLLDNDASGRHATESIRGAFPSAKDYSSFYAAKNCNDVNDFLLTQRKG